MTRIQRYFLAIVTILAPLLHAVSDIMEWKMGGFSRTQLILNYAGFLPMPFIMVGLYAVQRAKVASYAVCGAIFYGIAFIYFTHTTLLALENRVPDYETLWEQLGWAYTIHGGFMVAGGLLFAYGSLRARVLPKYAIALFALGILMNLLIVFLPLPDTAQIAGSLTRNAGLIWMGISLLAERDGAEV